MHENLQSKQYIFVLIGHMTIEFIKFKFQFLNSNKKI